MNIGVFDSGLGGLWMLKHLRETLPEYNYVFFGDEAHVPYGTKTVEELFEYTVQALDFLYGKENCLYVLLACNTTSATVYEKVKNWTKENYPDRKVFGVVRPTILSVTNSSPTVVFGTQRTVESHAYKNELKGDTTEVVLPKLASIIEHGEDALSYIKSFKDDVPINTETCILACTHYGMVSDDFKKVFPEIKNWILQEEIIPLFFKKYLDNKTEEKILLSVEGLVSLYISKENPIFTEYKNKWFGAEQEIFNI